MQVINSRKALFMIFSQLNCRKHIKYLLLAIVFISSFSLEALKAYESIFPRTGNIVPPFCFSNGFLPGGKPFTYKIKNENSEELSLEDFKGNVVVIVLFTTWCPSCPVVLEDMEYLVEKFKKNGINNIKIIALNIGNEPLNLVKIYYKGRNIQLLDVYHSLPVNAMSDIRGVPACLIFDKNGSPVCGHLGATNYSSGEFIEYLEKLAKQ
ncbi:MAG: TlpA family protein disulfide reductase [Holosporaceae bacterium]|jgi:thiol-disulfide isomerase/thioredoxin|nr:TlpA family protein disulfide reductase [Holosporaceae bacterium]